MQNSSFIITKPLVFNTKFLVFNAKFIIFAHSIEAQRAYLAAHPRDILGGLGGPRHNHKLLLTETRDCHVSLVAAVLVEHAGVGQLAEVGVDIGRAELLQRLQRLHPLHKVPAINRSRYINRRHVYTKQTEIYQSPACIYKADSIEHVLREGALVEDGDLLACVEVLLLPVEYKFHHL